MLSFVPPFAFPVKNLMALHSLVNFNGSFPLTLEARDRPTHRTEMAHDTSGWSPPDSWLLQKWPVGFKILPPEC